MTKKAMLEDLHKSGLTEEDSKKLGLQPLTKQATKAAVKKSMLSYKIPYFDISDKKTQFFRVRFLEEPKGFHKGNKPQRYTQPAGTGVRLYFPSLVDWKTIAANTDIEVTITEGEKKAAKASKEGMPTIGLGGVWSFRSSKKGKTLIDDFYLIKWEERTVRIIFDSDLKTNPNVSLAMKVLADELTVLGAQVFMGCVPELKEGDKYGLDDFLVESTVEKLKTKLEIDQYDKGRALHDMNQRVAWIEHTKAVFDIKTRGFMKLDNFARGQYAHYSYTEETDDGMKRRKTATAWLEWPNRRTHTRIAYAPGEDEVTENNELNIWPGWGTQPKKGDIKSWNKLLNFVFADNKEAKDWFEKWLAYPIQNPGAKLFTCVLLWSLGTGTGKTLIGQIMGRIYGDNYRKVNQDNMHGSFNEWAVNKQFILGDEITGSDKRRDADRLKDLITQESASINVKFQPSYDVKDCINYLFTSNHPDAFFLDDDDRRYFIHEIKSKAEDDAFYKEIDDWMRNKDGPAHLFYYLQNEIDCSDFNPMSRAPETESKSEMITLSRSDLDHFAHDLKENADYILRHGNINLERDLFSIEEIMMVQDPDGARRTTKIALSKALRRAGFRQLPVTTTSDGSKKLWALRNQEKWLRSTHSQRAAEYEKDTKVVPMKKFEGGKK